MHQEKKLCERRWEVGGPESIGQGQTLGIREKCSTYEGGGNKSAKAA